VNGRNLVLWCGSGDADNVADGPIGPIYLN